MGIEACAKAIKLLVLDVDGVLTNGQIFFDSHGEALKVFHTQDGLGIAAAGKVGLKTAIITGRTSDMVRVRAAELKIEDIYQGAKDKIRVLKEIMAKYQLTLEQVAYVGDDLNDLPVLTAVGMPCAVANAVPEVKDCVKFVSCRAGGQGGVREIIEVILKAQGKWAEVLSIYQQSSAIDLEQ